MAKVRLAFCIYAENPYGDPQKLAKKEKFKSLLNAAVDVGEKLNNIFGNIPRTYFCTGSHLEAMERYIGASEVRKIYSAPTAEVANHTYTHSALMNVRGLDGGYPRKILTPAEITAELKKTNFIIKRLFKRKERFGFSAPCGFPHPLSEEVAQAILNAGCGYSHSWTRGKGGSFFSPLKNERGEIRRPFQYVNGLWEVPFSGWQDIFNFPSWFNILHGIRFGKLFPKTEKGILKWWHSFLEEALNQKTETVALTAMIHPAYLVGIPFIDRWGIIHHKQGYDPNLEIFRKQLDGAKDRGVRITTVKQLLE